MTLPAGSVIFRETGVGAFVFLVLEGSVSIRQLGLAREQDYEDMIESEDELDVDQIWEQQNTHEMLHDQTTWESHFCGLTGSQLYIKEAPKLVIQQLKIDKNHGGEICRLRAGDEFGKQGMFQRKSR